MGERVWASLTQRARRGCRAPYGLRLLWCGFALLLCAPDAAAQYGTPAEGEPTPAPGELAPPWIFVPSITIGEAFTDNVGLATNGAPTSDLITTISPSLAITGDTPRIKLSFTYNPQLLIFELSGHSPTLQQQLQSAGRAEIYPETLFFDGSASIFQGYVSNTGQLANTTLTTNSNLQPVEVVSASPYLVHHFGSYADTETRYRFDVVATGASTFGTQTTNEFRQSITGGQYFSSFKWTLTGDYTDTTGLTAPSGTTGGSSSRDVYVTLDAQYPLFRRISATGEIGWERVTNQTLATQPNGAIWRIGLRYDPSPFASADFSYGRRYGTTDYEFGARYDIGPQTRLHASYTQTIETGQSLIATGVIQAVPGPNGTLINPQTGLPFVPGTGPSGPGGSPFGLSNGSFLDKRFQFDLTLTRGRNTYTVTAFDERQSEQLTASNQQIIGGTLAWTRQLWPDLSGNVSATYSNDAFKNASGQTNTYIYAYAGLTYALSRTATAQLYFSRSQTQSNQPGNSFVDDIVGVTIQKQF